MIFAIRFAACSHNLVYDIFMVKFITQLFGMNFGLILLLVIPSVLRAENTQLPIYLTHFIKKGKR